MSELTRTFVSLYYEAGGIYKALVNDPKRQGTLPVEDTLAKRYDPCAVRTTGFYVQDVRYVAGAWMRRSDHFQVGFLGA